MKLRVLSTSCVLGIDALPSTFAVKTRQAQVWWKVHVSGLAGIAELRLSHRDLVDAYTDRSKSHLEFVSTGHRDISRVVFTDRIVLTRMSPIVDEKSRDKNLTARWVLDLSSELPVKATRPNPKQELLVSYYIDGCYYERVLEQRDIPHFLGHRSIRYYALRA